MSSSYPWIKDSITLSGTPPADRLAVTSPNGLYFSTSTNSSILAPTNSNLTIETAGTGDVIVKTNGNNRLTIDDTGNVTAAKNIVITDGLLTINNTTGGGTSDPLLVLNQALSSQTLYEERNNTKTNVSTSQTLYQVSYKGLPSVGSTAVEYANMRVTAQSYTSGSQTSKIDFAVGPSYQSVLSIQPNFLQLTGNVYLPSRYIYGFSYAQTQYSNYLVPQTPYFIDNSTTLSFTPELANGQRIFYANKGSTNAFLPISGTFPSGGGAYCSESFNGRIWVGSDNYIYWTGDNGASWNVFTDSNNDTYYFNGQITCMKNTGSNLYFGGAFNAVSYGSVSNQTYNYVGFIDGSSQLNYLQWANLGSSVGLNGSINTIESYSGYIYYGGVFNGDQYSNITVQNIICSEESTRNLYALNNSNGSGFDGDVLIIKSDGGGGRFIIGGNFYTFWDTGSSNSSALNCAWIDISTYNATWMNNFSFNSRTRTITQYGSSMLVGGDFTGTGYGDYLITFTWNGSSTYTLSAPPFSATVSSPINLTFYSPSSGYVYWCSATSLYGLYRNGSLLGNSPANYWSCITYLSGSTGLGDCFAPVGNQFYYFAGDSVNITIGSTPVVNGGTEYTSGTITLPNKGNAIEFAYDNVGQKLYVLSNNGATGIGGSGGITTISAGSGISVTNPSGPTTTINNTGVLSLSAGSNISLSATTGNITISASGGGGGGDVYWSQLNSANTTYNQLGSQNYAFGLTDNNSYPNDNETIMLCNNGDFIGTFGTSYTAYLKIGDLSYGNYTLVANVNDGVNNYYCTMATVGTNMYLYADKSSNVQYGQGRMYLCANYILPGNFGYIGATSILGSGSEYWAEVNSLLFNNPSDIKLKENIAPLDTDYSLSLIKKVNPVTYKYKNDEKRKKHFGVIAQEIEKIIGDENLALHSKENDTQSICYTEFIAPLIKSVQFLLEKVESLEQQIKELKK